MTEPRLDPTELPPVPAGAVRTPIAPAFAGSSVVAVDGPPAEAPERLLVVPVLDADGSEPRFLLVRWADWPQPTMLSMPPPAAHDTLDEAVTALLVARLGLQPSGPARVSTHRVPVRMDAPRLGFTGTGWLRAVVVPVVGEADEAQCDSLLEGAEAFSLEAGTAALSTEVERMLLRSAAELAAERASG